MKRNECLVCGKANLSRDEIGINKKLLAQDIEQFYCLTCLAEYLEVRTEDILDKIGEFKREGCKLFE